MYVVLMIVLPIVFSMAWYKIVMQHFLMIYYGISLVFSGYTHEPLGLCVYPEYTSDSWDIP